jgi:hypothetical protein
MDTSKTSQTHPNILWTHKLTRTYFRDLQRIFMRLLPSLDSSHQPGMIPINTEIICTYFILTLSDLTSMGTALGYIVTQDLYIVWGLARGTLENSLWFSLAKYKSFLCFSLVILLWFSLASIEPSDPDCKIALTEEFSPFGGLKVPRYPSQKINIRRSSENLQELFHASDPSLSSLHPLFPRWPIATNSPNLSKAETWLRQLESHIAEIT